MHKLVNWSAKRSGPCMTIKGNTPEPGTPDVKLHGVYTIQARDGRVFAENGVGYRMAELIS